MYNGKQLKQRVSQFKDDELVTAQFITEQMVRNENTDGWWKNEFNLRFEGEKLTKKQVEQILTKLSQIEVDYDMIKENVDEVKENLI